MRKAFFHLDAYGEHLFEGYTEGSEWNGFARPYFEFLIATTIMETARDLGQKAGYEVSNDAFVFVVDDNNLMFDSYTAVEVHGRKLYPIGTGNWAWTEEKPLKD